MNENIVAFKVGEPIYALTSPEGLVKLCNGSSVRVFQEQTGYTLSRVGFAITDMKIAVGNDECFIIGG